MVQFTTKDLYLQYFGGYPLTILVQNWDANTWQTVLTDSFLYDLQNNLLSHSTYYTNQAQRILFDYNVLNQDTLEILQNFDFTLGQWQNANRTENEYNLSGLLKQSTNTTGICLPGIRLHVLFTVI